MGRPKLGPYPCRVGFRQIHVEDRDIARIETALHTLQQFTGDVARRLRDADPLLGGKALHESDADIAEQLPHSVVARSGFPFHVGLRARDSCRTPAPEFERLGDRDVIVRVSPTAEYRGPAVVSTTGFS